MDTVTIIALYSIPYYVVGSASGGENLLSVQYHQTTRRRAELRTHTSTSSSHVYAEHVAIPHTFEDCNRILNFYISYAVLNSKKTTNERKRKENKSDLQKYDVRL